MKEDKVGVIVNGNHESCELGLHEDLRFTQNSELHTWSLIELQLELIELRINIPQNLELIDLRITHMVINISNKNLSQDVFQNLAGS